MKAAQSRSAGSFFWAGTSWYVQAMKSLLCTLPLVVLLASTSGAQAKPPDEPAIAKVNGVVIPKRLFDAELAKITFRAVDPPKDRVAAIGQNILRRLIEDELVRQAVKRAKIVVPQADIDAGFREYKERFQSEEQFQNYLQNGNVTVASIHDRIRDRRALELLLASKLKPTRAEARDFYDKNERFYTEKAGIHAGHILIKLPEEPTMDELSAANEKVMKVEAALAAGEDFTAVATRMNEGPSKDGDLGWFSEGRMVEEFEDVAFKMRVGEISKPVRTRFGLHIIKLFERREDRRKTFEEVEPQIMKSLENKKFFSERRNLLADLERDAKIEKFLPPEFQAPANSNALDPDAPGDD